jgi:hypothetical protein
MEYFEKSVQEEDFNNYGPKENFLDYRASNSKRSTLSKLKFSHKNHVGSTPSKFTLRTFGNTSQQYRNRSSSRYKVEKLLNRSSCKTARQYVRPESSSRDKKKTSVVDKIQIKSRNSRNLKQVKVPSRSASRSNRKDYSYLRFYHTNNNSEVGSSQHDSSNR